MTVTNRDTRVSGGGWLPTTLQVSRLEEEVKINSSTAMSRLEGPTAKDQLRRINCKGSTAKDQLQVSLVFREEASRARIALEGRSAGLHWKEDLRDCSGRWIRDCSGRRV